MTPRLLHLAGPLVVAMLALGVVMTPSTRAADVGFIESFSLAKDRTASLKQLIPGTEDFYYYHGLHALNTEQYETFVEQTRPWLERFGQTPRLTELQTRHRLLTYDQDPKKTLEFIRAKLGLSFYHERELFGVPPNLPTKLDPKTIARDTLRTHSIARWQNLDNFEDSALDWLAGLELPWEKRRHLLQRLTRPDIANLPKLVAEDMKEPHPQGFGAYPIHSLMTLTQLEDLLKLKPELLNQTPFVNAYVPKLHPGADDDWKRDRTLTKTYLERLQLFVDRLAPSHNALKAHVLYHRLAFDRAQGLFDKDRFLTYLKLPRHQPYMAPKWLERNESQQFPADLNADYTPITLLPRIGTDEELVRSYLRYFFIEATGYQEFEPYINDTYLKHLFAETKIENGLGDAEVIASQLPPDLFRAIKDRIDIDFAPTNKTEFTADEVVKLDLFVKNVPNLLVKVFEINTRNVYRTLQHEVDTDINLDGLVANSEKANPYPELPLRRVGRKFEFPEITKPGVYIIDFIGGGKSSRALIRKGRLHPVVTPGTAGQVVTVVDETNTKVPDAMLWLNGQEYRADKDGTITVPFSATPGRRPIVLSRGEFSSLDYLDHKAEIYRLNAGIHIDRESLLTQKVAQVLIRPAVFLTDKPVSVKLLEDVRLRITSVDHAGIPTSVEVADVTLFEDRETTHEIRVPSRLASLTVTLTAKIKSLSDNKFVDVSTTESCVLNAIDRTDKIEDLHFAKFGTEYVIEVLGRSGEAKPDRAVYLALKHREFRQPVTVTLKSDAQGRVNLGPLSDIVSVTATGPEGTAHAWTLPTDHHTYRQLVHAKQGEAVKLPYLGTAAEPTRDEFALFDVQGATIRADLFNSIVLRDGLIELTLAAGDYDLWLKRSGERIRIRVVAGVDEAGSILGQVRHLQRAALPPVQIERLVADADAVTIQLRNTSPFTRVHLFATRYRPAFSAFTNLGKVRAAELDGMEPGHAESVYLTGRNIGDEYRYVLDRRGQKKYPGNTLERPMLLLNPWAVRSTETGEQQAAGGEAFGSKGGATAAKSAAPAAPSPAPSAPQFVGDFANLDFLADASAVVVNLVPDKDGVIKLPRSAVGPHAMLQVVAVDPLHTTSRHFSLPESKAMFADLRLRDGLDPAKHFAQQKQISVLPSGQPFVLADVAGSRFQTYDSLAKVYGLFATMSKDPKLAEFAFLTTWPAKTIAEKRTLYSKFACHELNFFLSRKDAAFFNAVVKPYLANKKDKTFLDHYLIDSRLSQYVQPWHFGRLNAVERILLAQRIPGEPVKTSRHLSDLLRLLPPNVERQIFNFSLGIESGAMSTSNEFGAVKAKRDDAGKSRGAFPPGVSMNMSAAPAEAQGPGRAGGGVGGGPAVPSAKRAANRDERAEDKLQQRDGTADRKKLEAREEDSVKLKDEVQKQLKEELFFGVDRPDMIRQLYRNVDPTQEWAENNYYHLLIQQQVAALIPVNEFWTDYAKHDGKLPFLSRHFTEGSRNFTEMVFTLAVLDLPFVAGKHDTKFDGGRMTLTPATPLIAFHEEVRPVDGKGGQVPILVSENFYQANDRFRDEGGEKLDKFVTDEFVVHTVYGCQVVVTNPTSSRQKLSVLVQLPIGAIPVANGQFTRSVPLDLEPYRTATVEYQFYFPKPGRFVHFPVNVAKAEQFVIATAATTFNVVEKPSKLDTSSWEYVSQNGTADDVLAFLNRENVNALNLEKIAFRMKDRGFYEAVVKLLSDRHIYHPTLWSYAILHADVPTASQFLQHTDGFVTECGGPITSPLLTIDPVIRHQYEHLEYKPLVNARAHALGHTRQIVNTRFHEQYHHFLKTLSYRKDLKDADLLAVTYYLLLQDRIEEALATFAQVNPDAVPTKIQYDYCSAYLEMFTEAPVKARSIAMKYVNHPVDRWRNTFATIISQLDEIEGKGPKVIDPMDRAQQQGQLAATEPNVEFTLDAKFINLTWQNLNTVTINYYLMDVELLFSRNPFVQQSGNQFAFIRPNATHVVKLAAGQTRQTIPLPDDLVKRNVLVEVTAGGKTRSLPYYANAMDVKLTENYGQLKATDAAGKPLGKVYVKVYAKLADGRVKFHKDGYTDLRGRFDYVSVNTPERQAIQRFSILVLSENHGATIREAAPPQQ